MAKKNRARAQRMAARGAAPKQITKATGVSRSAARKIVSRAAPAAPQAPATAARTKPKNKLAKTVNRAAKSGDISRKEMKQIMKVAPSAARAVNKVAKSGATLRTSAANYVVEQARANPLTPRKPNKPVLGTSKLGKTLGKMAGVPGYKPTSSAQNLFIKGERLDPKGRVVTGRPTKVVKGDVSSDDGAGTGAAPGLTEDEINKRIQEGIQSGIDDYFNTLDLDSIYGQQNQDNLILDAIANMGNMFSSAMGGYQQNISDQMALMDQFAAPPEAMRLYGAGQNYNIDAIRAARRNQQRRSGYLRGGMGIGGQSGVTTGAPTSGINIGSALGILGGVAA